MEFEEWVLHPGMLFGSYYKWWGNPKKRTKPHEGVDLCYYRTSKGEIRHLDERTKVPVIFKGQIVKVIEDFLGSSIFFRHSNFESKGSQLHTIYGHIKLCDRMKSGEILSEGNIIGTIADARERGKSIPSHLHISMAWIPNTLNSEDLSWRIFNTLDNVVLLDPLSIIKCPYSITTDIQMV
jgi:hypothetical protein